MTVKELREKLFLLPNQDSLVVTHGYEGGFCDVRGAEEVELVLNVNDEWYYGSHVSKDDAYFIEKANKQNSQVVKAYLL